LNLSTIVVTTINDEKLKLEKSMFGMGALIEESSQTLVIAKLFLFRKFSISSSTCANPLTW
jgi:hypothetical protein